ncbi:MAG TPA: Ldh family oxidoreductase [Vineibacter sp.]|nr:Ldh family oxidoreductase [Vineibacter sp.]
MRLTVAQARALVEHVMQSLGHSAAEAAIIADHLIDCELRGVNYGGLPRALSICERFARLGNRRKPIRVTHETPVSALVEGGDNIGYLVAHRAMSIAVDKARTSGIAAVAANDTWYTGMLSYFAEMAARHGFVSLIASNATPWVAPHGATEGRFGTNPICVGFPTDGDPVIWDIGTSSIMHAEVLLHGRMGTPLPEGVAFGPDGAPTRDPATALAGAMAVWGGHKGSGLAIVVQLLGVMCNAPVLPRDIAEYGCLTVVMSSGLFMPAAEFKKRVADYAQSVRDARPLAGGAPARMPFERSAVERRRRLAADVIEVPDLVYAKLVEIAGA